MIRLLLLLFLVCISHETDIQLEPFEDVTERITVEKKENISTTTTTTRRTPTATEICLTTTNITRDSFDNITETIYGNYLSCMWKSKKLQLNDGQINFTLLEEMIKYSVKVSVDITDIPLSNAEYIASEIIKKCKGTDGKTHGEKALKMRNCLYGKLLYQRKENNLTSDFEDIPYLEVEEETCVVELKLDALDIEDTNRRFLVKENNTDFEQFLECYWKDVEYMDKNGTFNNSLLKNKLIEDIEFELLSRSRAVFLTDILTKSILSGCKHFKEKNEGSLVLRIQKYILQRLPYFKLLLQLD